MLTKFIEEIIGWSGKYSLTTEGNVALSFIEVTAAEIFSV